MRIAVVVARFNDFVTERLLAGAREALAETSVPVTSSLSAAATNFIAEWKHAAYPAANSCSGFVAPPAPPISFGTRTSTSSTPSSEAV